MASEYFIQWAITSMSMMNSYIGGQQSGTYMCAWYNFIPLIFIRLTQFDRTAKERLK